MKMATIGLGAALLAGCGASGNDSAASVNGVASAPAQNQTSPAPPVLNQTAPTPPVDGNRMVPGPSDMADGLVGRWGRQNGCAQTMEFFADGRVTIPDGRTGVVRWRVTGPGRLELSENGRGQTGGFEVREGGRQLRLTNPDGRVTDLTRC